MKAFEDFGISVRDGVHGETKTVCPQCSAGRKKSRYPCLSVNVDSGVWNCWHCGWGGSLKSGVERRADVTRPVVWRKPDKLPPPPPDPALDYLSSRGITPEVVKRNRIGFEKVYFPQVEEELNAIAFPYFRGGELVNVKYRSGAKYFRMEAGCELVLYGLDDIDKAKLVWVEGEIDKLSCDVAGVRSCVSVPNGAPTPEAKNVEKHLQYLAAQELEAVELHVIAVDADEPGRRLRDELVRRLGPEKCSVVVWPEGCKDANDVLITHGSARLAECIRDAQPVPIAGIEDVCEEDLDDLYINGDPKGVPTGWREVDHFYTVRPGELTVVTGIPNSGKSEWLDALCVNIAEQEGWRMAVYSPENAPTKRHIAKLSEKRARKPFNPGPTERMTKDEWEIARAWVKYHFIFFNPENPTLEEILAIAKQVVRRYGVRGLVLDPWNEIEHSRPKEMSETEYVGKCLSTIKRFARHHDVHAWVVAHPAKLYKKEDGKYPVPSPYDISGSANWRNKPDACLCVWRDLEHISQDVQIHVQKIRFKAVGQIGVGHLIYDRITGRYHDSPYNSSH